MFCPWPVQDLLFRLLTAVRIFAQDVVRESDPVALLDRLDLVQAVSIESSKLVQILLARQSRKVEGLRGVPVRDDQLAPRE